MSRLGGRPGDARRLTGADLATILVPLGILGAFLALGGLYLGTALCALLMVLAVVLIKRGMDTKTEEQAADERKRMTWSGPPGAMGGDGLPLRTPPPEERQPPRRS